MVWLRAVGLMISSTLAGVACGDSTTTLLVHVTAPDGVEIESLTARVAVLDEEEEAEHEEPPVTRPEFPGVIRVLLPDVSADVRVQLVAFDQTGARLGAHATV